jgi:hypothetical protein
MVRQKCVSEESEVRKFKKLILIDDYQLQILFWLVHFPDFFCRILGFLVVSTFFHESLVALFGRPGLTFGECFSQPLDMVKLPEKLQHLTLRYAEPLDARARDCPRES